MNPDVISKLRFPTPLRRPLFGIMAQSNTGSQSLSPAPVEGPTKEEVHAAISLIRQANPGMGKKKLLSQLNVAKGWTITCKELRQHINTIDTEENHSNEDQTAATITENKHSSGPVSAAEEATAVRALMAVIKREEDNFKDLEAAPLAAKEAPILVFIQGGLLRQPQTATDSKEHLQLLRMAAIPRSLKKCITQLNANEGWATDSWAFEMLRSVMAISRMSLNRFYGPLIIALPPSGAAAQRLAKEHNLPVRGWSTHLGTTDAVWRDPEADREEMYSIAFPSRSDVPRFQNLAKNNIRGQQLTYLLAILATFSIEWPEATKLFSRIWCQPDIRAVLSLNKGFAGARVYDEMREEELKEMWEEQMMYGQDLGAMRLAMESIDCEKQVEMRFFDEYGHAHKWLGSPMATIELGADQAGVVLVKREVCTCAASNMGEH